MDVTESGDSQVLARLLDIPHGVKASEHIRDVLGVATRRGQIAAARLLAKPDRAASALLNYRARMVLRDEVSMLALTLVDELHKPKGDSKKVSNIIRLLTATGVIDKVAPVSPADRDKADERAAELGAMDKDALAAHLLARLEKNRGKKSGAA